MQSETNEDRKPILRATRKLVHLGEVFPIENFIDQVSHANKGHHFVDLTPIHYCYELSEKQTFFPLPGGP